MSLNTQVTISLAAPDDDGVCVSQTPSAGGAQNLTINGALASGGIATLDVNRRVLITSSGNDSGRTFTIYGTNRYGNVQETITGPNTGVVYSVFDYKTITRVSVDGNTAGNIKVGTNQIASTQWFPFNLDLTPFNCSLFTSVSNGASLTYTVEHTPVDIEQFAVNGSLPAPNVAQRYIFPHDSSALVVASTSQDGNYAFPVFATRLTLNTYASGDVVFFVKQAYKY